MKFKAYLIREHVGYYTLLNKKPQTGLLWFNFHSENIVASLLCPCGTKKYFGLKNHIRKGSKQIITVMMDLKIIGG